MDDNCVEFVPFADYDWTFARKGWLKWNPTAFCLIAAFCGIAYWMCIELVVLVYVTFKRHSGLYFWSIIVTTIGIVLQTTGYILKEFKNDSPAILTTIICKLGWVSNVTGFSIVLWSRLHLVVRDPRILRLVLAMIIVDGILLHTPVVVFEFGLISRHHNVYIHPMEIMERIQQTIFTLQETIISGLYIYHTTRFLNGGYPSHTRKVIGLLVAVQVLVIALDAGLTTFDYMNMFTLKCTVHPFVYSVKLKLEFIVLNQLLGLVKRGVTPGNVLAGLKTNPENSPNTEAGLSSPKRPSNVKSISEKLHVGRYCTFHATNTAATSTDVTSSQPSSTSPSALGPDNEPQTVPVRPTEILGAVRADSDLTLQGGDETDLKKVVGKCDDFSEDGKEMNDIERQYLGRYGM